MKKILSTIPPLLILITGLLLLDRTQPRPDVAPIKPPVVKPSLPPTPNEILIQTGRRIGVLSISSGRPNEHLQRYAQQHADYMARVCVQGHQGWNLRYASLRAALPGSRDFAEVANESWPNQSAEAAAAEMYRSWRYSSGHWAAVNGECEFYGYAMALGQNGTWYACGIFAK
jgi:hypothetical protein